MNTTRIPFSLSQKVYIVKTFYKTETIKNVIDCMQKRFNIKIRDNDTRVISQIVLEFESSGSVVKEFSYGKTVLGIPGGSTPTTPVRKNVLPESFWAKGIKSDELCYEVTEIDDIEEEVVEDEEIVQEYVVLEDESGMDDLEEIVIEAEDITPNEQLQPARHDTFMKESSSSSSSETKKPDAEDWQNCVICNKWFPRSKFRQHVKDHHLVDDSTCKECGMQFPQFKYMLQHMKVHAPLKPQEPLICEVCGKISTSRKTAKAHMLVHSTEKKYECEDCGMRFVRLEGLRRHRRTHTGEKPYRCEHCGAAFAAFMSHQMHVRLHTGERPFKCHHCDEAFIGAPALNNHLKIHAGEYMHECGVCSSRFKTEKTLAEHVAKKHNSEIVEMVIQS